MLVQRLSFVYHWQGRATAPTQVEGAAMIGRRMLLGMALLGLACLATVGVAGETFGGKTTGEWLKILREHKDVKFRHVSLIALETIGAKPAGVTPGLLDALRDDPDEQIRQEVAILLGRMGPDAKGAVEALGDRLANDKSGLVRQAAAAALGGKLAKSAESQVPTLAKALKDKYDGTRRAAAETLKNLGELAEPAVPQLTEVAQDPKVDRFSRVYAIQVIGQFGKEHKSSGPALVAALADKDAHVSIRQAAAEALGRFGGDFAAGVEALGQALETAPPEVRRTAAVALGSMGEKSLPAWSAIKKTLQDKKSDNAARNALIRAAASVAKQQDDAVPVLAKLAQDDDAIENRLSAIQELGELGGRAEPAVPTLRDIAQNDARASVRQAAEAALKKIKGS
jgi:HEAT repeat protein